MIMTVVADWHYLSCVLFEC